MKIFFKGELIKFYFIDMLLIWRNQQKEEKFIQNEKKADYVPDAAIRSKRTANLNIAMIAANISGNIQEQFQTVYRKPEESVTKKEKRKISVPVAVHL